jgi:dTDP-4-amino-4,6-dideoxygalactose transaminase
MHVPLLDLAAQEAVVTDEALAAVASVARKGQFVLGPRVEAFETWLADACGARHAVGVASGTDAIELSLRALGVGPGDAVITPAFSFIAAAEAVAAAGARPVFCDVDADTMTATGRTVDEAMDRARGAGLRVRAMVPVHLFGRCAPMSELTEIAEREGMALVEDAAQALGARDDAGRSAGAVGDAGCFSFFPTKNLGAWGDAGAVVTSSERVAANVRRLRTHGAVAPHVHAVLGRNSRLDALQASVLLAKAGHVSNWQAARTRIAARYIRHFARLPLALPRPPETPAVHAWSTFVVRVHETSRGGRDSLATWLRDRGIETRVYYPVPIHRQECFRALEEPDLPHAEQACRTALALPIFPTISEEQEAWVIEQVTRFFGDR